MLSEELRVEAKAAARAYRSIELDASQLAHLELLMNGYYGEEDECPLAHEISHAFIGDFFPPFRVSGDIGRSLRIGERLALRDREGALVAILTVESVVGVVTAEQSKGGSENHTKHPEEDRFSVTGFIEAIEKPVHYDFPSLRLSAGEVRCRFERLGCRRLLAYYPDGMIYPSIAAQITSIARKVDSPILVQILAGMEDATNPEHYLRVRCITHTLPYLATQCAALTVLPRPEIPQGIAGILWRAGVARSAGATHLLTELAWWEGVKPEDRLKVKETLSRLGIELIDFLSPDFESEVRMSAAPAVHASDYCQKRLGGKSLTKNGDEISVWKDFPKVLEELHRAHRLRSRQGVTVFFTGLSGAGKSTIARALLAALLETGERTVTLLDGDIVRKHLSSELGFSRQHRDLNILRIGFVASEITKHGGIAICAPIAPYRETRRKVRQMIEQVGGFVEVYVATPLEVCEARDRKGLYAKARAGLIKEFTGISDPYEEPERPELVIDTRENTPFEAVQMIISWLKQAGFLSLESDDFPLRLASPSMDSLSGCGLG